MKTHFRDLKQFESQLIAEITEQVNARIWEYFDTEIHKLSDKQTSELFDFIDNISIEEVPVMKAFFDCYKQSLS